MTYSDQTALWAVCTHQWSRLMARWRPIRLPRVEWEDIRSEAFIRVFQRAERYDPTKGSPETWVRMVMHRSIINSLRRFIPNKTRPNHIWRTNLRFSRPLSTCVMQTGRWGEEVVVVEPDMIDENATSPRSGMQWEDFIGSLTRDQRIVATERARGCSIVNIHARYFRRRTYQQVWKDARDIRKQWEAYCQ